MGVGLPALVEASGSGAGSRQGMRVELAVGILM